MALQIFKYNRIQFDQLYSDVRSFMTTKFLQVGEVFSPASAYGQLLYVILDLARLMFYYIEDSITELNIMTAGRSQSIIGLARLAGHNPTRSIAASGTLMLGYNGTTVDMYGNTVIIPNYSKLVDQNTGLNYLITTNTEEVRINLSGKQTVEVKVTQGSFEVQTVTGTGRPLQSYNIKPKKGNQIDNFIYRIYVNNEQWKNYDSLYDIPYDAPGVIVKTGMDTGIDIFFGNLYFGRIPEVGSVIRVEYLVSDGDAGNILMDEIPNFEWEDDGFDLAGNTVDLNAIIKIGMGKPIIFGSDAEPLFLTRVLAPKTSRAYVLANADSYVYFLEKYNFFAVVDAFNTFEDNDVSDDNVVYLFLIPDVNKRKPSNSNYYTIPQSLFLLSPDEKQKIYDVIEESGQKTLNTIVKIIDPIIKKYVLNLNVRAFEGYSKDIIRQNIISKTSDYFLKNRRRDKIPTSDLVAIVESVEGVDSVNVWFMSEENEAYHANPANANSTIDIGLDEFGDITIGRGELALVRGGWPDRNGVFLEDSTSQSKPSTINISFGKDTPKSLNLEIHRINIDNIKNG
jgi:hypothetical protein